MAKKRIINAGDTGCVKKGAKYAGDHVKAAGKMDGDTITVAKITKAT